MKRRRRKKVWIINYFATPPDVPGGTRHYDFGVEMAREGYDVTIFASNFNYMLRQNYNGSVSFCSGSCLHDQQAPTDKTNLDSGSLRFTWIRSASYKRNNWRRAVNMLSFSFNVLIRGTFRRKPTAIIGSSPHLIAALSAYFLAKIKGCQFYFEVRDLWPQVLVDMGVLKEGAASIRFLRKIESLLYRKAKRVIYLSEGAGKYISDRGISPQKLLLLPNGVYLERFMFSEERDKVRSRLGLTDEFVVMYTGAHGPANALDTMVDAAILARSLQTYEKVVFVLVGDGPEKDRLQRKAEAECPKNVRFLEAVAGDSIPDLLNAADALVITLRAVRLFSYAVSPNKLFDYMASRKPIICAVSGETAELVRRAQAGITIEPEDPGALLNAVASLMNDEEKRERFGKNGRRFAEEHYSRSDIAKSLIAMLERDV